MKTYIKRDTKNPEALWLIVERTEQSPEIENLMGIFRDEDLDNNIYFPVLPEEVSLIKEACEEWLERESQGWMN